MSPDDIDSIVLGLYDLLVLSLGASLDEDEDYVTIYNFLHNELDKFCTRERNYN